jgi:hypothetical protein|nr:MAG TPA: hypothetical protein [Caudoviricetes sp.]
MVKVTDCHYFYCYSVRWTGNNKEEIKEFFDLLGIVERTHAPGTCGEYRENFNGYYYFDENNFIHTYQDRNHFGCCKIDGMMFFNIPKEPKYLDLSAYFKKRKS